MKNLLENTPFAWGTTFKTAWLDELDADFMQWAQDTAFWLSDRKDSHYNGFDAVKSEEYKAWGTLLQAMRMGTLTEHQLLKSTAMSTKKYSVSRYTKVLAWMHELVQTENKNSYNVVEAVYCFYAQYVRF